MPLDYLCFVYAMPFSRAYFITLCHALFSVLPSLIASDFHIFEFSDIYALPSARHARLHYTLLPSACCNGVILPLSGVISHACHSCRC